jgi:hypothetical protein
MAAAVLVAPGRGQKADVVNCIVAIVNSHVITLADVKLTEAFGFFDTEVLSDTQESRRLLLDKLIGQKVVIDLAREKAPVDLGKIGEELRRIMAKLGQDPAQGRLEEFGISEDDLLPYCEEKVLCETIIANRFGRSAGVSLREIEAYYTGTFVSAEKKLGHEPRPMIEVLDLLEAEVKKSKIESQAARWIANLRQQAEIEIRPDCLKK